MTKIEFLSEKMTENPFPSWTFSFFASIKAGKALCGIQFLIGNAEIRF